MLPPKLPREDGGILSLPYGEGWQIRIPTGEYTSARFAYYKSELGLPKIHSTEDAQHQDSNTAVASGLNYTLSEFLGTITPAGGPHETVPHPQMAKHNC